MTESARPSSLPPTACLAAHEFMLLHHGRVCPICAQMGHRGSCDHWRDLRVGLEGGGALQRCGNALWEARDASAHLRDLAETIETADEHDMSD